MSRSTIVSESIEDPERNACHDPCFVKQNQEADIHILRVLELLRFELRIYLSPNRMIQLGELRFDVV
ncbi:hypothetical protein LCGC14_0251530 [marine sediment metagenome]|uniref:Uncharacterized protein n=1 Tax=marine sediment metagenome TaxID=412755 RepID=A0A0F9WPH5_9ZZZZ